MLVTCEDRCFDMVCEELARRGGRLGKRVHVVNFDITDNPEDATIGARAILQLCQRLEEVGQEDLDDHIEEIINEFQSHSDHPMYYSVLYY